MFRSSPEQRRQAALAPILNELDAQFGASNTPIPETVTIGDSRLTLNPWERNFLREFLQEDEPDSDSLAALLTEVVAYQLKCQPLLDHRWSDEAIQEHHDEWVQDAAVGLALLDASLRVLDGLLLDKEPVNARMTKVFRVKLGATVQRLQELIGNDAFERAEAKATKLGARNKSTPLKTPATKTPEKLMPLVSPEVVRSRRLVRWIVMLAVVLVAWGVFILPGFFESQPPLLEPADFSGLPGLVHVVPRPPSLFLELDPPAWDGLDVEGRLDLLEEVGEFLGRTNDYNGAYLRTTDGRSVGRWLRFTGVELIGS